MTIESEKKKPAVAWEDMNDEQLLNVRIRDLNLNLKDSALEKRIHKLYKELEATSIGLKPPCYLADEWFCPDGIPVIGIPFYLSHHRLAHLEQKMMLEIEGGTETECMKLLRHETGHALNYAYQLHKRTRWRELFGSFTAKYGSDYAARPYSRRFVINPLSPKSLLKDVNSISV